MRLADTLVLVTMILGAAILIYAVIAPIFDTDADSERDHEAWVEKVAADRAVDTDAWFREYQANGTIYPDLFPESLAADAERLAHTADLPAVAPLLVPLPQAGSREPDAVYGPGDPLPDEPLPEGEIAGWVATTLLQFAGDAESTFVRQLYTVPLGDVAGQFNRPLALTAGGGS